MKRIWILGLVWKLHIYLVNGQSNVEFSSSGINRDPVSSAKIVNLTIGYMTGSARKEDDQEYSCPGLTISGALTLALSDLNSSLAFQFDEYNLVVNIGIEIAETFGKEEDSVREVAELWQKNVSVIIGPQESCLHEGRLASSLNIPMISYFCSDEETSDKEKFSTFSRTRPPDTAISRAVASLLVKYAWKSSLTLIYPEGSDDMRFEKVVKSLLLLFDVHNISSHKEFSYRGPYYHGYMENPFEDIVKETKDKSRIYILVSEYFEHLGLVVALSGLGLLGSGEYLVIGVAVDDYKEDEWDPGRYFNGLLAENKTVMDPEIFKAYVGIVASPPRNFTEFSRRVNEFMEKEPFQFNNPLKTIGGYKKIRIEAAYLYDAVVLYAGAVRGIITSYFTKECLLQNCSVNVEEMEELVKDGKEISARLRNITFLSATTLESEMDRNGDATGNFTLVSFKTRGKENGLYPVGYFVQAKDLPELRLNEDIEWIGQGPPLCEPKCGFEGEKCQGQLHMAILCSLLASLGLVVCLGIYLVIRHWQFSREMESKLWRIDESEIRWETGAGFLSGRGSHGSLAKFANIYAPLVTYQGRLFAVKTLLSQHVDSCMRSHLTMIREIRHENLNAVVGACIRHDDILLIQEYCSRGSLKDILENGDIKLDDMFISSLVGDLLRGLSYLHDTSAFRYHGNLKPTNCLVDSRWVLKLSDFGWLGSETIKLQSESGFNPNRLAVPSVGVQSGCNNGKICSPRTNSGRYSKSPYVPPENFSGKSSASKMDGTTDEVVLKYRRGDAYSLGVVLWELLNRKSLLEYLGAKDEQDAFDRMNVGGSIAHRGNFWQSAISNLQDELTRGRFIDTCVGANCASISPPIVLECIRSCLELEPEARPDIKSVRIRLRPLHRGMGSNIFDTMIGLMEKYANNLEILVDNRTQQLYEEKRKTEQLLYEMIPPAVANELKEGLQVPAQTFNCVSVYFSDIVGFTAMSAESTPLQVVEFLNDLYTCFDSVIENFDVYKIETIGDAYMVASGLPLVRGGNFHALEMARMALELLEKVRRFKIKHRPDDILMIRIGIHSGPCCAGVVGLKRPRYCLFGDTVNTASRMESTGQPQKIHCSETFAGLVNGEFVTEPRGMVDVKGKGEMRTYWLTGNCKPLKLRGSTQESVVV